MNRIFPVLFSLCLVRCAVGPVEVEFSEKDPDVIDTDLDGVESDPPVDSVDTDPVDTVEPDTVEPDTVEPDTVEPDTDLPIVPADEDKDGWTVAQGDCDDLAATVHPLAPEVVDGLDNDCDGFTDEGMPIDTDVAEDTALPDTFVAADTAHLDTYDTDFDCAAFDTYTQWELGCFGGDGDGDGFTEARGDCDDADPSRNPAAAEVRDGLDNDCDGLTDEGGAPADADGDGFTVAQGDCDDANGARSPNAVEVLDGIDNDCDGLTDEGAPDADGDGYTVAQGDCNDGNAAVHPNAPDPLDGVDRDCDGTDR